MHTLTQWLDKVTSGEPGARDELFAAAYAELGTLARSRLRRNARNASLETGALVHETYLRFLKTGRLCLEDRRAFFAYASRVMRSVIIDAVRQRQADRRGGGLEMLELDTNLADVLGADESDILRVHEALLALEQAEPRLAQVVEMRYFGGYSEREIAQAIALTERTVRRDCDKARMLLGEMLRH